MPAGYLGNSNDDEQWLLQVGTNITSIEDLENLMLVDLDGVGEIRLKDVADITVVDNVGDAYMKLNGSEGVCLMVYKSSTASTSDISNACQAKIADLREDYPGLSLDIVSDQGSYISLYINSPGGVITSGLAIYDTMNYIKCDVSTICMGQAASMAAVLLACGAPGKRYALPNSRVMIHQPSGGAQGQQTEIEIAAKEILYCRDRLNQILADHTGQSLETIHKDTERDNFMSAQDACAYGIVDQVVASRNASEN